MPRGLKKRAASEEQVNKRPPARKKFKKVEDKPTPQKQKLKNLESNPKASPRKKREALKESVKKSKPPKKVKVVELPKKVTETDSLLVNDVSSLNVEQLLALGESCNTENNFDNLSSSSSFDHINTSEDSDSENDFEEVKEVEMSEPVIPKEGVNITLDVPNLYKSKRCKNKSDDVEAAIKRQVNRVKKGIQLLMHKVHLLCWIAHLKFVNNVLNSPSLLEVSTLWIKSKNLYPPKYADLSYLEGILKWFHKNFELKTKSDAELETKECSGLLNKLLYQLKNKEAYSCRDFTLMFITLIRILGLKARIIMSFQVLPVKPAFSELFDIEAIKSKSKKNKTVTSSNDATTNETSLNDKSNKKENKTELNCEKSDNLKSQSQSSQSIAGASKRSKENKNVKKENKRGEPLRSTSQNAKPTKAEIQSDSDEDFESEHFKPSKNKAKAIVPNQNYRREIRKNIMNENSKMKVNKTEDSKCEKMSDLSDESESDFTIASLKKKIPKRKGNNLSSPSADGSSSKKQSCDIWTEIYLEAEEKWISVDVLKQKIHCVNELYSRATHPVAYVLASNNDGSLKDVTKRYVPNYHSDTRKRRVDDEWWNDTLKPYLPLKTAQDKEEDEDISRQLSDKPLPSTISEYKNHPLYVLQRHLLKFEAVYPPDAPTLGFVRGEPVYARECVAQLHSREMWYKEARLVRLKEEPYKIVKARPKFDKMTGEIKKDLPLELFGRWQTEDYIPPIATDGKVPRNEYGNVDLFKSCMLPIGTVHLQIPNLNKVARKLGIDCAPATVGFDFHSGASHPVFDGFVVCEEFKTILLDTWNKEVDETAKKNEEKKEKRVYGNWKRLIRGLLIREKLKLKYAFGENESNPSTSTDFQEEEEEEAETV